MVDVVNTYEEPVEDANHVQEMLDKAEALEQPKDERPDWLPEKFKSVEEMANSYNELEKKLGQQNSEENEDTIGNPDENPEQSEVREELESRGLDFDSFADEFEGNGELSDASYEALAQAGIPQEIVDQYLSGLQAEAQMIQQQAFGLAGGEQGYAEMTQWAAENLPDSEIDAFNEAVNSGDWSTVQFAIKGLAAQYRSEVGTEPSMVQGSTAGSAGGVFSSVAELTAAMRDPRYETDPAYRRNVSEKLSRSTIL